MKKTEVIEKLKKIIAKSMELESDGNEIEGSDLILELGINSVDALEILIWVENEFGIQIEDEDLNADLITSLDNLSNYVLSKMEDMKKSN